MREYKVDLDGNVVVVKKRRRRTAFKDRVKSAISDAVDWVLGFLNCLLLLVLCEFFLFIAVQLLAYTLFYINGGL